MYLGPSNVLSFVCMFGRYLPVVANRLILFFYAGNLRNKVSYSYFTAGFALGIILGLATVK